MRRQDLPVLTALRFPAAAAIVLFHYLPEAGWSPSTCEGLASGVSFFYVLSGFILYYNYLELADRGSFWMARFARIWPLHFITFLMALVLIPFTSLLGHAHWPITMPANLLLVHAWLPFHGSAFSYNGVSWSLSVEAFFYLCFPWLLTAIKKTGVLLPLVGSFALGLALVSTVYVLLPGEPSFGSFDPVTRLFEFILGMSTCHLWFKQSWRPDKTKGGLVCEIYEIGAMIAVTVLMLGIRPCLHALGASNLISDWLVTAMSAIGFSALIWIFAYQAGMVSTVISSQFFVRLGEISFAVYMCHQIILRWLLAQPFTAGWGASEFFAVYLLSTLGLSYLLFSFVETPARHLIIRAYKSRRTPPARMSSTP